VFNCSCLDPDWLDLESGFGIWARIEPRICLESELLARGGKESEKPAPRDIQDVGQGRASAQTVGIPIAFWCVRRAPRVG